MLFKTPDKMLRAAESTVFADLLYSLSAGCQKLPGQGDAQMNLVGARRHVRMLSEQAAEVKRTQIHNL